MLDTIHKVYDLLIGEIETDHEVDLLHEFGEQIIPFEVKYRFGHTGVRDLKGLLHFCETKSVKHGYGHKIISRFRFIKRSNKSRLSNNVNSSSLLCYWMGESELSQNDF